MPSLPPSPLLKRLSTIVLVLVAGVVLAGYYPPEPGAGPPFSGDASVMTPDFDATSVNALIGGKKTLIFYFLPSCPHCRHAAPAIARLAAKYGDALQFLGVASGRARLADVRAFGEEFGFHFPLVQDVAGTFGRDNGIRGFPTFILTDGRSVPPERYSSFSDEFEILLETAIVRYLGRDPLALLKGDEYLGSVVCSSCHRAEYLSWSMNHHSVAINSLLRTKKEKDKECIRCHVTGYGAPDGYKDLKTTPWLAEVGCESCHGRAGGHRGGVPAATGRHPTSAAERYGPTCLGCHDARHSLAFDVAKGIPLVGHHRDRDLDYATWLERKRALTEGGVERPLLSFAPGAIMGAESCASCHADIHAKWKKGPHGTALESLKRKGKEDDLTCVGCHTTDTSGVLMDKDTGTKSATGGASGAAAASKGGTSRLPGVQCESCHGPGEMHVRAGGGKGNIVSLTGSCPVCVIEAICAQCHTSSQDPDFEIESALKRITH